MEPADLVGFLDDLPFWVFIEATEAGLISYSWSLVDRYFVRSSPGSMSLSRSLISPKSLAVEDEDVCCPNQPHHQSHTADII